MKNDHKKLFRELKMKATPKRLGILSVLEKENRYLTPEDVWSKIKPKYSKLGLPTVYRNLEEMEQRGLISRISHPDRRLYYYFCNNKSHHHHFVCDSCRRVEDVSFCMIGRIEHEIKRGLKAEIKSHLLQINGTCEHCLKKEK